MQLTHKSTQMSNPPSPPPSLRKNSQQGGLLASWVEPIFLSSLVVSADPRTAGSAPLSSALARAVPGRAELAIACQPSLSLPPELRSCGDNSLQRAEGPGVECSSRRSTPDVDLGVGVGMSVFVTSVTFNRSKAQVRFGPSVRLLEQGWVYEGPRSAGDETGWSPLVEVEEYSVLCE